MNGASKLALASSLREHRDPLRMYLVVRRGAVTDLARAGELACAAAVACVREPCFAEAVAAWRPRPGKVCLRARSDGQWQQVLEEPHTLAGDAVAALPPRRRSERGPLLERLQAMSTDLGTAPESAPAVPGALTFLINPDAPMSSGKTLAQIAHAAVMAADTGRFEDWVAAGCPARVLAPTPSDFVAALARDDLAACVADAGLTEVAPGTVTVLTLP
jgi:Peptidyl-tRNA hydrolase PTH2